MTDAAPARTAPFGMLADGSAIEMHTLASAGGMQVRFIDLGGAICSLVVPDYNGNVADITPGYDRLGEYVDDVHYLGALVGRFAGRIAHSQFSIDGKTYTLPPNDGPNLLHGGVSGFHNKVWNVEHFDEPARTGAVLTYTSPDGEGGFPGTLFVRVTYTLTDANELSFDYVARTDHATPVNLLQHFYMNLGGHNSGDILDHELTIHSARYLAMDERLIPTGQLASVAGTPLDFRSPRRIGPAIEERNLGDGGFDDTFALDGERVAARLVHPRSGRTVEIETTEPGLHLYAGNKLGPGPHGKNGAHYGKHSALALETQHFPDSPNIPAFPNTILRPGSDFVSRTVYRFGANG
jgi:aldose 1-epimerase